MIQAGRNRWKIENENNNILKTKECYFEHNYGLRILTSYLYFDS